MTNWWQKVDRLIHRGIIMFCRNAFLASVQHQSSGTEGEIVAIFHNWLDSELMMLILGLCLKSVVIVFHILEFVASLQQHLHLKHYWVSQLQLHILSKSAFVAKNIQGTSLFLLFVWMNLHSSKNSIDVSLDISWLQTATCAAWLVYRDTKGFYRSWYMGGKLESKPAPQNT